MQAEPSNFLLERDAIVAACRKREGEGLSSNDTVGRGGEGRLSYSALEGGVGRTLQLYLARAAAAAAAARCQPVTPSVHRARNKQESGCTCRALPAKYPYQLPPFNSPAKPRRRSVQTRKPRGSSASVRRGGGATRGCVAGIYVCPLPLLLRWKQAATREPTRVKTRMHPQSTAKLFFLDCWCNVAF
jgi:hypothetical protein